MKRRLLQCTLPETTPSVSSVDEERREGGANAARQPPRRGAVVCRRHDERATGWLLLLFLGLAALLHGTWAQSFQDALSLTDSDRKYRNTVHHVYEEYRVYNLINSSWSV